LGACFFLTKFPLLTATSEIVRFPPKASTHGYPDLSLLTFLPRLIFKLPHRFILRFSLAASASPGQTPVTLESNFWVYPFRRLSSNERVHRFPIQRLHAWTWARSSCLTLAIEIPKRCEPAYKLLLQMCPSSPNKVF